MLPEDSGSAKQSFDLDQVKALVRSADGDWKGAIMVALYTGARLSDLVNMRWESIDLQNKWITFRASKTRQRSKVPIKIPMHEALYDFLLELPASDSGKSLLFPSLAVKGGRAAEASFDGVWPHYGASKGARRSGAKARR